MQIIFSFRLPHNLHMWSQFSSLSTLGEKNAYILSLIFITQHFLQLSLCIQSSRAYGLVTKIITLLHFLDDLANTDYSKFRFFSLSNIMCSHIYI